jgi:ATP-binding cassette subfamily B protein
LKNILKKREYTNWDLFALMWRVSPFYAAVALLFRLIGSSTATLTIFATAGFINAALAVGAGTRALSAVFVPIGGLLGVMLYQTLVNFVLMSYLNNKRKIYFRRLLRPLIIGQVAALSYRHIENQDTADLISRVVPGFDDEVIACYNSVLSLGGQVLSMLGVIATVMSSVWWAGLIIIGSAVPLMFIAKKAGERSYEARRETSKITRKAYYLSGVLKSRDAVEERTVYGYTDGLNDIFAERYHTARKIQQWVNLKNFVKSKLGGILSSAVAVITILTMIPSVLGQKVDYGMFIALMGGIFSLVSSMAWGINNQIQEITAKKEYLKDLTKFMALDTVDDATTLPAPEVRFNRIAFEHVSFTYPGTEKLILDDISFTIDRGRHYSFVGVNGAGKTTITKLLTGLYTNYTGEILVDGRSLRAFTQAELKGLSTVVYQDFAKYSFSLYDNIAVGNPDADEKAVDEAVKLIGLTETAEKLPQGLQTYLGKVYKDGVDLSGGEWQRVAMARSLVSGAPLRILDEPTAALDPLSESRVYSQFEQISQGKTTIFISHRLGSTKLADTIYVLAEGRIAEQGSHSALLAEGGLYADMFSAQAGWYTDKAEEGETLYA